MTTAEEGSSPAEGSSPEEQPTRALQSLKNPEPDLEVVVGPSGGHQESFRYHSVLLASYSSYVDTMLSSGMRESSNRKITFPDIEVEEWKNLLSFLEPGGLGTNPTNRISLSEANEVLPLYEKYDFHCGVKICDRLYERVFALGGNQQRTDEMVFEGTLEIVTEALTLATQYDLPRSKLKAVECARQLIISLMVPRVSRQYGDWSTRTGFRALLPILSHDRRAAKFVIHHFLGKSNITTVQDMRDVLESEELVADWVTRCGHLELQSQFLDKLDKFRIQTNHPILDGKYGLECFDLPTTLCNLRRQYVRDADLDAHETTSDVLRATVIRCTDPFGKTWEIALEDVTDLRSPRGHDAWIDNENRTVLYRWQRSDHSSLIPPSCGWSCVEGPEPVPTLEATVAP